MSDRRRGRCGGTEIKLQRKSLVDVVVDDILDRILSGEVAPGSTLPPEAGIAERSSVSRLTAREAINVLRAQNIVTVKRGLGTFVNPLDQWTGLSAILRAAARGVGEDEIALRLLEVRRMVETGSAELAASNRTDSDLSRMRSAIDGMKRAYDADDVESFTRWDLDFHDAIFSASRNPFVPAIMGQLGDLLYSMRRATSAFGEVQRHAIEYHEYVLEAIQTGEPSSARQVMEAHINQTFEDYERFIGSREHVAEGS
ncbi:FadR/GntR family transcriptional regulator [Mycetocola zhujimingii]|uniref:FadR/GntR family transcriptional regulator n=1 Tax=Mycetocola zhujimingii TaxID=2079792 RepID=UPI001F350A58|nr:FadR/GntR family transcriptional regulator [Mycetocola zhujimingii]